MGVRNSLSDSLKTTRKPAPTVPEPGYKEAVAEVMVSFRAPPEVSWQLKQLANTRRMKMRDVLHEAVDDLFAKHEMPRIAKTPGR